MMDVKSQQKRREESSCHTMRQNFFDEMAKNHLPDVGAMLHQS
jgi:hypothetical protein